MTGMIEQVARVAGITPDQATLAIKAMREPTDFMVTQCAGHSAFEKLLYSGAWRCMIDAALGEEA